MLILPKDFWVNTNSCWISVCAFWAKFLSEHKELLKLRVWISMSTRYTLPWFIIRDLFMFIPGFFNWKIRLYHVIQLPVMTSDWKRMNKGVVNNVNKNKKTLIPPSPVRSPGAKGGWLRFRHVKVYWVYLKLEISFLYMSVSIYTFLIFS